jgi:hypothetical protein
MSLLLILAEVRPTDVWDSQDAIGAVLLVVIVVGTFFAIHVIRRK